MNKSRLFSILGALGLVVILFYFGKRSASVTKELNTGNAVSSEITIDTILHHARENLTPAQITRLDLLEKSITRGDVKSQQLNVFHELAHFWKDSARIFEPYAWYEAEASRLEYSEKSLTFAAHLFLDNLRNESIPQLKKWKALQAKDLFERSLRINDKNDSSLVGLGACYIFGGIAENPMEGILKVRQVAEKDSTNIFAQLVLGQGSTISGQYDKAISRFERVNRLRPDNLEAILLLAEVYERIKEPKLAIKWYSQALPLIKNQEVRKELQKRIEELKK